MSKKSTLLRFNYELLIAFLLASLVFSFKVNTILTGVFVLIAIIGNYKEVKGKRLKDRLVLVCSLFFMGIFISALLSSNTGQGFKFLERNISFLVIPISTFFLKKGNQEFDLSRMLRYYLSFISVLVAISLLVAFYKNHMFNIENEQAFYKMKSWFFTYHYLAQNINCSAIYLSLYVGFCIQLLVFDIMGFQSVIKQRLMVKAVWLFFLITILLLLSARTIIFFTLISSVIVIGIAAYRSAKLPIFLAGICIVAIFGAIFVNNNDVLRLRLESAFASKKEAKYFSGGLSSRLQQWELISEEILENEPFFGVGIGDADIAYQSLYKRNALDWAAENRFNAHSIYMETFFLMGSIGLLLLLILILTPLMEAMRYKNWFYLMFLVLFCFAGLTESLLNRQYGIVFFVMLTSVFHFWPSTKSSK